jgi:hypothetical protein
MRITIKLDQPANADAFAVLWLDLKTHHWSREMHSGVDIPSWGLMRAAPGTTLICAPDSPDSLCALTGLDLEDRTHLVESQSGQVSWHGNSNPGAQLDRWHVQCIESNSTEAEHEVFDE